MNKYEKLLGQGWYQLMQNFLKSEEFKNIGKQLKTLQENGTTIYPVFDEVFNAFSKCPYKDLTAVFITTNAYVNGEGHDGMAFSCAKADKAFTCPEVLSKIFEAMEMDVADGLYLNRKCDLSRWAKQGIFLLNLDLTSESGKINGHVELWKPFMDYLIKQLNEYNTGIQYVLIGKEAAKYEPMINKQSNDCYLLEHPMIAVSKKRPWRHKSIFSTVAAVSKFLNNNDISWL